MGISGNAGSPYEDISAWRHADRQLCQVSMPADTFTELESFPIIFAGSDRDRADCLCRSRIAGKSGKVHISDTFHLDAEVVLSVRYDLDVALNQSKRLAIPRTHPQRSQVTVLRHIQSSGAVLIRDDDPPIRHEWLTVVRGQDSVLAANVFQLRRRSALCFVGPGKVGVGHQVRFTRIDAITERDKEEKSQSSLKRS